MLILAFETSAKAASVALLEDGKLLGESYQNTGLTHSQTLLVMAQSLLDQCGKTVEDVTATAVAAGPGSFTGVRIGVAAAKGFAWGREIPCYGVSTLEAMALSFGDVGKALVVVIMVMQIAGSSGTFPIELLPDVYQKIYHIFPFPYAIDAVRECVCGLYGTTWLKNIGCLLIFGAAALVIGLLVRKPFMGLNHFMEE